ncbi:ATP-binding protein [Cellulomonas biazotea]|uniref:ATP-binding protein n=3 Tax=Cellulomonas biazotea TaxID=1709 RepID=UPI0035E50350
MTDVMEGFDPDLAQFRLERIQLVNWGPFHGYHVIDVHRDGTLVTGPSGAGKSTLLDAMICVLMDRSVTFNAAAHDDAVGSRERTFYSYARGKSGSRRDESRGSRAIYLREGATWSAVALTWRNRASRTVTACRAMHLTRAAAGDGDITHALLLAEQDLDVRDLAPLADQRFRSDAVRRSLPGVTPFGNEYGRYVARLSALVGIRGQDGDSAKAIRLLHKAQSSKGVHNIDETFKRFVLDDSRVAQRRDAAVEQFLSLRNGYEEMTRARDQIAVLGDLPRLWDDYRAADESTRELRALVTGGDGTTPLDAHVLALHKDLLAARADDERAERVRQRALHEEAVAQYEDLERQVRALEQQRGQAGGDVLRAADDDLRAARAELDTVAARAADLARWCATLDVAVPTTAAALAALQSDGADGAVGTTGADGGGVAAGEDDVARGDLHGRIAAVEEAKRDLAALRADLRSYETRRSNVPAAALAVRAAVAEGAGLTEADLPFVGELLDVAAGEEVWRPAAQRLLGGFGLGLLVDAEHRAAVARFVDAHDLRARVRYTVVDTGAGVAAEDPQPGTMAEKVVVADGPFAPWLREQLVRRFSHRCVHEAAELALHREAVTVNGQVKHRGGLHEKDDRPDARRDKVIGFDNADTVRDLTEAISRREHDLAELTRARDTAEASREHARARRDAHAHVADVVWAQVDVGSAEARVAAAERRRADLADGDALAVLDREVAALVEARNDATHRARSAHESAERAERSWARSVDEEDRLARRLEAVTEPDDTQTAALAALADECDAHPTLESVGRLRAAMQQAVERRVATAESAGGRAHAAITTTLADFLRTWPDEAGVLTRDVDATPDFLELLATLQADDLPAALAQWRQLMHNLNTMGLTSLVQTLRDERLVIDDRIAPVNEVLRTVPFGHDGYLQIVTTDVEPPASRAFKAEIDAILDHAPGADLEDGELEARFARIARLMDRLDSTDPVDRDWQRDVLDVKRHVRIAAEEHRRGEDQARVYEGVGATSGGEGQELIAATLGAALRYQLGGIEAVPMFGSVMVDEGFVKSDPDVTRRAIRALKSFGFQLLIAAPLDKYQSMEREFGSAYLVEADPAAGRAQARGFAIGFGPGGAPGR